MLKQFTLATLAALTLSGCELDDSDSSNEEASGNYSFDLTLGEVSNGVAEVSVKVSDNNGDALPDANVTVTPMMNMTGGMQHGTPFSANSGELDDEGEFTTTAYFLMPSAMDGTEETKMGDWSMTVEFDGESQTFPIEVIGMSDMQKLLGGSVDSESPDLIPDNMMGMGETDEMAMINRTYYVFNRGRMVMGEMNSFEVYVAAREDLFAYSAITGNQTLNDGVMGAELTIDSVSVKMCINECEVEDNWKMAMADENADGIYKGMNLGFAGDDTDNVQVKLILDEVEKLKGDNARANFTFEAMDMAM